MKLDKILDTIFFLKGYCDAISVDVVKTSHALDLNWIDVKLSSLDGLLLVPDAKRAEELSKRNHHLNELSQSLRTKLLELEDSHQNLTVLPFLAPHSLSV